MISFILSILGLINSVYLTSLTLLQKDACIIGSSCQDVINSAYGMLFGLPVSIYGILFFSIISYITYQRCFNNQQSLGFEVALLSIGSIVSLYLMIIQFFIVNSFCIFCSFSATVTFILLILSLLALNDINEPFSFHSIKPSRHIFIGSTLVFLSLISFVLYAKSISNNYAISLTSKQAAVSSIRDFSTKELNDLSGIEYTKARMQMQSIRKQSFMTYIAKHDASILNLQLDQYYQTFVQNKLRMDDQNTRNAIKRLKGNPSLLQQYLSNVDDVDRNEFRNRFDRLQTDILTYYDASFLLDTTYKISIQDNQYGSIQVGNTKAPLQVIIFSDFLCSHCAQFHASLDHLFKRYPDFFNITYRSFPIRGQFSEMLSLYGICAANQNNYLAYADSIYSNQNTITYETINDFIPDSLDKSKLNVCIQDATANKLLDDDINEVRRLNIQSTPTVFLNGYLSNIGSIQAELSNLLGVSSLSLQDNSHSHDHSEHKH